VAAHAWHTSRANILAVCFVIAANMPARCHQRNEMKLSILPGLPGSPIVAVKSLIKGRPHPLPSLIANHSQLEGGTRAMPLNAIV
jgi:hypothetical protein